MESCKIPDSCHYHLSRVNSDPLPFLGLYFPQGAKSADGLSWKRNRTHQMLRCHVTPYPSHAGASRRVQMKTVFGHACQHPTENVGPNDDSQRWIQTCVWGGRFLIYFISQDCKEGISMRPRLMWERCR
jgi:hypothetical protein